LKSKLDGYSHKWIEVHDPIEERATTLLDVQGAASN